jgi:hypothetical protein
MRPGIYLSVKQPGLVCDATNKIEAMLFCQRKFLSGVAYAIEGSFVRHHVSCLSIPLQRFCYNSLKITETVAP